MKDAFGGSFILRIMLIFFVVFISFMVVAINFAKTYRVKNGVIDILERSYDSTNGEIIKEIDDYLKAINYGPSASGEQIANIQQKHCKVTNSSAYVVYDKGICIVPVVEDSDGRVFHYKVTSFMVASFFSVGLYIPISGETRTFNDYFD